MLLLHSDSVHQHSTGCLMGIAASRVQGRFLPLTPQPLSLGPSHPRLWQLHSARRTGQSQCQTPAHLFGSQPIIKPWLHNLRRLPRTWPLLPLPDPSPPRATSLSPLAGLLLAEFAATHLDPTKVYFSPRRQNHPSEM